MYSAPSAELRFSAAIDGSLIQSCNRFTASSWRFVTSALIGPRSSAALAENEVASATKTTSGKRWYVLIEYLSRRSQRITKDFFVLPLCPFVPFESPASRFALRYGCE